MVTWRRSESRPRRRAARTDVARDGGFSIVESVVAGAILSIGAVMAMQYFATAAAVTVHQRTNDQATGVAEGVLEAQESLGCLAAVTSAQVTSATGCSTTLGGGTFVVTRDSRTYTVTLTTGWVVAGAGTDTMRLKESATVTWPDGPSTRSIGPIVRLRPLSGQSIEVAGSATVTVTAAAGTNVAMVVGGSNLVHTADSTGTAVFPYLAAGTYQFKVVGSAAAPRSVTVVDGGSGAVSVP